MPDLTNEEIIQQAAALLNPKKVGDYLIGDVGSVLISESGNIYRGVCIDVSGGMGFCAEHSAIAAMITAGEYKIKKIVAVWRGQDGLYVLPPCGRCREFMRKIEPRNAQNTDVILAVDKTVKLIDLLPYSEWTKVK